MNQNPTEIVRQGYNRMAQVYNRDRDKLKSGKYLQKLIDLLPPKSEVLDLGCGAGVPVDSTLLKHGFLVTGLDLSETQIALARKNCPTGNFLVADMSTLKAGDYRVDAVVSFYAIFHLPRDRQGEFLKLIASFLTPGGYLLITMGDREFEGTHDLYGVPMYTSHFGPVVNRKLVTAAGFRILLDELDRTGSETHQVILAVRNQ